MSYILKAVTSYPKHLVKQSEVNDLLVKIWPEKKAHIEQFIDATTVETRYLSLPLNYYRDLRDMGKRNVIWKAEACQLQKENMQKLLSETNIEISDIGLIVSVTTTGLAVPTLDALMMNQFPFSPDTKRLPLFGLGCLGGVAGINRVHDYLVGHPEKAALLMVTELCSLTFQLEDESVANLVGATLFGDGAAAVLMVGNKHPLSKSSAFEVVTTESVFYPETERLMGWDMIDTGFQLVLSGDIPAHVKEFVGKNIDDFLMKNNMSREDIGYYVAHPGGPKVLSAICETMNISKDKLALSWESLSKFGNTSASSVLNVLEETIKVSDINPKSMGLMMAMGPAFSLELSLLQKC